MTYNPNIPQTGTRIDQTYNLITTNFGQLNTIFGNDHFTWNDASVPNRGRHKKCTLVAQSAVPSGLASAGIAFTQINPASNINRVDPYYKYDTSGIAAGLVPPLVPFKAFCEFTTTRAPVITTSNLYNVTSVAIIGTVSGSGTGTFLVTFTNPLSTDPPGTNIRYLVLLGCSIQSTVTYSNSSSDQKNNSIKITVTSIPASGNTSVSVGVIQL